MSKDSPHIKDLRMAVNSKMHHVVIAFGAPATDRRRMDDAPPVFWYCRRVDTHWLGGGAP
jgi:hypothetical protein